LTHAGPVNASFSWVNFFFFGIGVFSFMKCFNLREQLVRAPGKAQSETMAHISGHTQAAIESQFHV
jgi:hypothetical protein